MARDRKTSHHQPEGLELSTPWRLSGGSDGYLGYFLADWVDWPADERGQKVSIILKQCLTQGLAYWHHRDISGVGDWAGMMQEAMGRDAADIAEQFQEIGDWVRDNRELKGCLGAFVDVLADQSPREGFSDWEALAAKLSEIFGAGIGLIRASGLAAWRISDEAMLEIGIVELLTDALLGLKSHGHWVARCYIPQSLASRAGLSLGLLEQVIQIENQKKGQVKCRSCLDSVGLDVMAQKTRGVIRCLAGHGQKLLTGAMADGGKGDGGWFYRPARNLLTLRAIGYDVLKAENRTSRWRDLKLKLSLWRQFGREK